MTSLNDFIESTIAPDPAPEDLNFNDPNEQLAGQPDVPHLVALPTARVISLGTYRTYELTATEHSQGTTLNATSGNKVHHCDYATADTKGLPAALKSCYGRYKKIAPPVVPMPHPQRYEPQLLTPEIQAKLAADMERLRSIDANKRFARGEMQERLALWYDEVEFLIYHWRETKQRARIQAYFENKISNAYNTTNGEARYQLLDDEGRYILYLAEDLDIPATLYKLWTMPAALKRFIPGAKPFTWEEAA